MPQPQADNGAAGRPGYNFNQEIRFAVVMYGGSSLAIYINGVAQELLRMVRATAPDPGGGEGEGLAYLADEQLEGSERVYRHLGRILSRGESPDRFEDPTDLSQTRGLPIRTRLVVDILTGSSAGGINGIYLAKALANDQGMDELKKLWVTEGDIGALINDDASYEGLRIGAMKDDPFEREPFSVLNSRRMYVKLLDALRGMDYPRGAAAGAGAGGGGRPLVDDLDLYVTTTDITGKIIQLRLADKLITERRHRNVFHFRHRIGREGDARGRVNDFRAELNAFLAFAARATSAHQAAFSPVNLEDVGSMLKKYPLREYLRDAGYGEDAGRGEYGIDARALRGFYRDYLVWRAGEEGAPVVTDPNVLATAFGKVWFNDGGTLDNKPFTFLFNELPHRPASASVDRKLLYVEPSPEHLKWARAADDRPLIAQNAWGGLSTLPSYETVVQDLTRLLERNRLIERVRHITADFEDDIRNRPGGLKPPRGRHEMGGIRMEQLIKEKGTAWGGYQRLRIAQVTDDLTLLIARAAGIDEDSDEYAAIRQLVRHWRTQTYDDHKDSKQPEIKFLLDYDLQWTLRRVRFVLRKIDELTCFDKRAEKLARLTEALGATVTWPREPDPENSVEGDSPERKAELIEQLSPHLRRLRSRLSKVLAGLNAASRSFWAHREDTAPDEQGRPVYLNPFRDDVDALRVTGPMLLEFLSKKTDAERAEHLRTNLAKTLQTGPPAEPGGKPGAWTRGEAFGALVEKVGQRFVGEIEAARKECYDALRAHEGPLDAAATASHVLHFYFRFYEDFDQITFPILYSTDVGEEMDPIEVFRVSPEDAEELVNEKKEGKLKLAGTTLGHFGAFFERKFRINDIMWGRLDGAERIIAALLPAQDGLRRELTKQAHRAIIGEEADDKIRLAEEQAEEVFARASGECDAALGRRLRAQVAGAITLMRQGKDCLAELRAVEKEAERLCEGSRLRAFLLAFAKEFRPFVKYFIVPRAAGTDTLDAFKAWFDAQYEEGRQFSPGATLETAVRVNRVLGGMALGYFPAERSSWSLKQKALAWAGERVQIFTESAIQTGGEAHQKLKSRLHKFLIISVLLPLAVLLLGVVVLAVSLRGVPEWIHLLPILVCTVLLLLPALILALAPLVLTGTYYVAWLKFKSTLAGLLPRR